MDDTPMSLVHLPARRSIRRVALACIQCRSRKVRCDATKPACNRCRADEKECEYQKSRRGGRPRRLLTVPHRVAVDDGPSPPDPFETFVGYGTDGNSSGRGSSGSSAQSNCDGFEFQPSDIVLPGGVHLMGNQVEQLLNQYYAFFHASHPCVLPRWSLNLRLTTEPSISSFLLPILLYIGSIFTPSVDSTPLSHVAAETIKAGWMNGTNFAPDPYSIQAQMLYSIAVYWCDEPERGREILDDAIQGAFLLGMHQRDFAVQNGYGDPVLEESWRRTWWQIHVTDIHIAGSTHTYNGLSVKYPITADLPCEEECYETGVGFSLHVVDWRLLVTNKQIIPTPTSLKNYDAREFSDIEFSSFAQLVGLTQGISRVLATRRYNDIESARITCENADTMMTAWSSLLPPTKSLLLPNSTLDPLLFKATLLLHTYTVDLHRPLSTLSPLPIESLSKCAPPIPLSPSFPPSTSLPHTTKILASLSHLHTLLTLPTDVKTHTPFIICMIANMTVAHLAACRSVVGREEVEVERERIRLNMGVLKRLGEVWPAGGREFGVMGVIARSVLGLGVEEVGVGGLGMEGGFGGADGDGGEGLGEWWGGMAGVGVVV